MATPRRRARQACLACNARRVKCDVIERLPCRNCIVADVPCEIRESRRGKHPRPRPAGALRHNADGEEPRSSILFSPDPVAGQHIDEHVAASQVLATLSREGEGQRQHELFDGDTTGSRVQPPTRSAPLPQTDALPEDEGTVFLGESTSIRYMHSDPSPSQPDTSSPQTLGFRHSIPSAVTAEGLMPEWETRRRQARIDSLRADGAFSLPPESVVETLLGAYFRWFHRCFAIVDEGEIRDQYQKGTLSPLLLQAMLLIATVHCDDDDLHLLGLGSRHMAKCVFYNRAKDIYDAEFEPNKLTVIQALFLMSFWRAGALLEKDARHWLSAAISLAQTKGLHRAAGSPRTHADKVRKRLWWSIYVRERQCAAALGLPNRFRDEDCDVEPLDEGDFDHAFGVSVTEDKRREYVAYSIRMAQLSQVLGRVVHSGYLPKKTLSASGRSGLKDELIAWRQGLPPEMQLGRDDFGEQPSFHANMLHLAYNNLLILLYRSGYIGTAEESQEIDGQVALQAAVRNSRIIEEMLANGNLRHGQVHTITNLFNTLCIHTVSLRASQGTARAIAEHRAKLCLLGLQELQKTWEVRNWVLQLFFQYLDSSTAARLRTEGDSGAGPYPTGAPKKDRPRVCTTTNCSGPESRQHDGETATGAPLVPDTPWSWSTEEASHYLFSQIESDFAFGEGSILEWHWDDAGNMMPLSQIGHSSPSMM